MESQTQIAGPVMEVTRCFRFDAAHVNEDLGGKCGNLHGHSYHLRVTVRGCRTIPSDPEGTSPGDGPRDNGLVMDAATLKRQVKEWVVDPMDHSYIVRKGGDLHGTHYFTDSKTYEVDCVTTVENLALHIYHRLVRGPGLPVSRIRLRETDSFWATVHAPPGKLPGLGSYPSNTSPRQ